MYMQDASRTLDAYMHAGRLKSDINAHLRGVDACVRSRFGAHMGFYDVLFKGRPFEFQHPYGSYVMENVLFKISYLAEFHTQTAVEAVHKRLKALGKSSDIKRVCIRMQAVAVRIIDK
jgi:2-methylcitrate dehydratase PrpD